MPAGDQRTGWIARLLGQSRQRAQTIPPLLSAARRAAHSLRPGEHRRRRAGTGETFWQFRPYDTSDRPQDIDWRASSRGDSVLVREKERQSAQTFLFWADSNPGMDYRSHGNLPTKHESAIILNLALAVLAAESHEMSAPLAENIAPGYTEHTLRMMGESFLTPGAEYLPPSDRRSIPRRASIVMAGDFLSPADEISRAFAPLAQRAEQGLVMQILDPAELSLPFSGRVLFESHAEAPRFHVPEVEAVRADYMRRIRTHVDIVAAAARQAGWTHILHTTDTPVEKTLSLAWAALAKGAK